MARYSLGAKGQDIHLAIEGSVGGTSLALHLAADAIENGGRVIWAGKDLPNAVRFSQLFSHLSLIQSSRFHAMSIAGNTELAVLSIIQAMNSLPSVSMIVIDDWCESGGRIASSDLTQMVKLRDEKKVEATLLLVSKGSIDVSGNSKDDNSCKVR